MDGATASALRTTAKIHRAAPDQRDRSRKRAQFHLRSLFQAVEYSDSGAQGGEGAVVVREQCGVFGEDFLASLDEIRDMSFASQSEGRGNRAEGHPPLVPSQPRNKVSQNMAARLRIDSAVSPAAFATALTMMCIFGRPAAR
jgi:hypothetical protein